MEFDAVAGYAGLLIGVGLGIGSPLESTSLQDIAIRLCVTGSVDVGRGGATECDPFDSAIGPVVAKASGG